MLVESPAIQVIFSLLSSQLCQRSSSHLLLALSLLELVLTAIKPGPRVPEPAPSTRELPVVPEEGEPAQPNDSAGPQTALDTDTHMEGKPASGCPGMKADTSYACFAVKQG